MQCINIWNFFFSTWNKVLSWHFSKFYGASATETTSAHNYNCCHCWCCFFFIFFIFSVELYEFRNLSHSNAHRIGSIHILRVAKAKIDNQNSLDKRPNIPIWILSCILCLSIAVVCIFWWASVCSQIYSRIHAAMLTSGKIKKRRISWKKNTKYKNEEKKNGYLQRNQSFQQNLWSTVGQ